MTLIAVHDGKTRVLQPDYTHLVIFVNSGVHQNLITAGISRALVLFWHVMHLWILAALYGSRGQIEDTSVRSCDFLPPFPRLNRGKLLFFSPSGINFFCSAVLMYNFCLAGYTDHSRQYCSVSNKLPGPVKMFMGMWWCHSWPASQTMRQLLTRQWEKWKTSGDRTTVVSDIGNFWVAGAEEKARVLSAAKVIMLLFHTDEQSQNLHVWSTPMFFIIVD